MQVLQCLLIRIAALRRALHLSCTHVLASAQQEGMPLEPLQKFDAHSAPHTCASRVAKSLAPCPCLKTPPISMHTYQLQAQQAVVAVHTTHYGLYIARCPSVHIAVAWLM